MNTNPPKDNTYFEGSTLPVIINLQKEFKTGIIKTATGKKFPVTIPDWIIPGIQLLDYVEITKSQVTGEWVVTNYHVNVEFMEDVLSSHLDQGGMFYE